VFSSPLRIAFMTITPDITMGELQTRMLGARRTLFRHYHIGGCSSCGFTQEETLAGLCLRNENLDVSQVIRVLQESYEEERKLFIPPTELQQWIKEKHPLTLVDVRSKEEHEAVALPGSVHFDQNLMQQWMLTQDRQGLIVFYDHQGRHVLDAASYFIGHGFSNVKCLEGGIDAWALQMDSHMRRYVIE
jgi:rhodanese-related sulfurtransferase